jgi:hypothetical protein
MNTATTAESAGTIMSDQMQENARQMLARPRAGLALLRQPVEDRYIAQLPKPTKAQTDAVKADFKAGRRCKLCGTWHHPDVVHLDYVGHAATTARLLEADENWTWEPAAWSEEGLPRFDKAGGLWIRLTVCGVSRLGYGNADSKNNADAGAREKEVIGDAIRNAAMRFGWALELWHKGGDLFLPVRDDGPGDVGEGGGVTATTPQPPSPKVQAEKPFYTDEEFAEREMGWAEKITDAKEPKDPDRLMAFIETKGKRFTDAQREKLRGYKAPF